MNWLRNSMLLSINYVNSMFYPSFSILMPQEPHLAHYVINCSINLVNSSTTLDLEKSTWCNTALKLILYIIPFLFLVYF